MKIQPIEDFLGQEMHPEVVDSSGCTAKIVKTLDLTDGCREGTKGLLVHYVISDQGLVAQVVNESTNEKAHWVLAQVQNGALAGREDFRRVVRDLGIEPFAVARIVMGNQPERQRQR
jgi:hypothetical protein